MVNRKIDSSNNGTDTQGHGIRVRPDDKGRTVDEADTDGHMPRVKVPEDKGVEDADSEGHGAKFRPDDKGVEDADTEGHAAKLKP
jgi:hypothetical protein